MVDVIDALIVGAGPAGTVAAAVLARAGARVRLVDRARFPRDKLCGDTVNPGTLALLRRLGLSDRIETRGLPIEGMLITGGDGVAVESRYPVGSGRALVRRELTGRCSRKRPRLARRSTHGHTFAAPSLTTGASRAWSSTADGRSARAS